MKLIFRHCGGLFVSINYKGWDRIPAAAVGSVCLKSTESIGCKQSSLFLLKTFVSDRSNMVYVGADSAQIDSANCSVQIN